MTKIFCENCKQFRRAEECQCHFENKYPQKTELCLSPNNFKGTHQESSNLPLSTPAIINRYNNCVWYDPITPPQSTSSSSSGECSFINDMPQ